MEQLPILKLESMAAGYDGKRILHDVDLTVYAHDFLGIIGPNGGGKTTLIKVMLGLLRPEAGRVSTYRGGAECHDLRIGYLPQYSAFDRKFPITVKDVVLTGLLERRTLWRRYGRSERDKAEDILRRMDLQDQAQMPVGELSGGQRQRMLIGRALICDPELLILDEPNTYIDRQSQEKLYELLGELDCAVVLVSHDIGTVLRHVRNIACVNRSLHYHPATEVGEQELERTFGCPFEMIAHGHVPHRVLEEHGEGG